MFCPECGAEFREGIEKCADCDVALTPEPLPVPEAYVTVYETSDPAVVPVLKTVLESAGIPYRASDEGTMDLFPLPSETFGKSPHHSGGEVKIQVPPDRADEAREILETAATVDEVEESDVDAEAVP